MMKPAILELMLAENDGAIARLVRDGQSVARVIVNELSKLAEAGRELSCRAATGDASVFEAVEMLARKILPLTRAPATDCVYLRPDEGSADDWRKIEMVPWEVLLDPSRACVVRANAAKSHPPLDGGQVRVLIVLARPSGPTYARLSESSPDRITRLVKERLAIEPTILRGSGTLAQLKNLPGGEPYHIVHVIAHGSRARMQVCLEDKAGFEQHVAFATFADAVTRLRPSLVTLQMCNSSPLALELNARLQPVRIVGALHDVRVETLDQFFAYFYDQLLTPQHGPNSHLEAAFRLSLEQLGCIDRVAEWFQLVAYAPIDGTPFLNLRTEQEMQAIFNLVNEGKVRDARDRARALTNSPSARIRDRACPLLYCLERVLAFIENLSAFEKAITEVATDRQSTWRELHNTWSGRDFEASATGGGPIPMVDKAALLDAPQRLSEMGGRLHEFRKLALDGVGAMVEFEGGKVAALLAGCRRLLEFAKKRGNKDLHEALEAAFENDLDEVLTRAALRLSQSSPPARILESLEVLGEAQRLSAEATSHGVLTEISAANITGEIGALLVQARNAVIAAHRPMMVPAQLLAPGRRFELITWLRERDRGVARPPAVPDDLEGLLGHVGELAKPTAGLDVTSPSRRRELLPMIANEGPPFVLASEAAKAAQPYVALAAFNLAYDTPNTALPEIETAICRIQDVERRQDLLAHHATLADFRRRLTCDVAVIPCRDSGECERAFHELAAAAFSGRTAPELPSRLDPLDRAALLCTLGRSSQALAIALEQVNARASDLEAARIAYLIALHRAEVARDDAAAVATAARAAIGLVGMIAADSDALSLWVTLRLAAYRVVVPSELPDLVKAVARTLAGLFDDFVARYVALGDEATALGRALQDELRAELEAAENPLIRKLVEHKALTRLGGYHGARLTGSLETVGEYLVGVYQTLSSLKGNDYINLVGATGLSVEGFRWLVVAFSDLRIAQAQPAADALRMIGPLLPTTEDLLDGVATTPPQTIAVHLDACTREQMPFHTRLAKVTCERVLAAHIAMIAADKYRDQVEHELARDGWTKPLVVSLLDQLKALGEYVLNLGYKLGGVAFEPASQIDGVLQRWLDRVVSRLEQMAQQPEGNDRDMQQRKLAEAVCKLADSVASRYVDLVGDEVNEMRASFHRGLGMLLHNAFGESLNGLGHFKTAFTISSTKDHVDDLVYAVTAALQEPTPYPQRRRTVEDVIALLESRRASLDRVLVDDALRKLRRLMEPNAPVILQAKPELP